MFEVKMDALHNLSRLNRQSDDIDAGMTDFLRRQLGGEEPDPALFSHLMQRSVTVHNVMQAQMQLDEKPIKTVLAEIGH